MSLNQQLEQLTLKSQERITPAAGAVMKQSLEDLAKSGIIEHILKKGACIPDFALPNTKGKIVDSDLLLSNGPIVISFYRGGWCPYCNLTLRSLEKALPEIKAAGGTLVAISPEMPDSSLSTVEKDTLSFEVLSDSGNKLAKQFGIVFKLSPDLANLYKGFGIDLAHHNGDKSDELPLAATFIVAPDKSIVYAFADTDYKKRMEPVEIIEQLKSIRIKEAERNEAERQPSR